MSNEDGRWETTPKKLYTSKKKAPKLYAVFYDLEHLQGVYSTRELAQENLDAYYDRKEQKENKLSIQRIVIDYKLEV